MEKIKPMVYGSKRKRELLYAGSYKKYHFYVMSLGTHPTAYVEIPETNKLYNIDYMDIDINVHGGLTFSDKKLYISDDVFIDSYFIGWDYAHYGDYFIFDNEYTKKWTTEEIIKDCKKVIDQVKKIENKENKK